MGRWVVLFLRGVGHFGVPKNVEYSFYFFDTTLDKLYPIVYNRGMTLIGGRGSI